LQNKGFEEERMTKIGVYNIINSTTPKPNKSHSKNSQARLVKHLSLLERYVYVEE
jgi:hypothetical protein